MGNPSSLRNVLEFLHGFDPMEAEIGRVPQSARVLPNGSVLVQIRFNPDAAGEWRVEKCSDLSAWQTVDADDYEVRDANFRILVPDGEGSGFYRLMLVEAE